MSLLNGIRWPEAGEILRRIDWPSSEEQVLQACVVLRRSFHGLAGPD